MKQFKIGIFVILLILICSISVFAVGLPGDEDLDDELDFNDEAPFTQDIEQNSDDFQDLPAITLKGTVTHVGPFEPAPEEDFFFKGREEITVVVTSRGDYYGREFQIENVFMGHPLYDLELREGQRVVLYAEIDNGEIATIGIQGYARDYYIYILLGIFVAVLLLIGGKKGLLALVTLVLMGVVIVFALLPLVLRGYNPLMLAIVFSSLIAVVTLFIVGGFNNKSLAAICGVIGGLIFAGILAVIFGNSAYLTGFSSEEAQMLTFIDEAQSIDIRGLLFAGIIIGTLGAVLDVGMSVASSMFELKKSVPNIKPMDLFNTGMNIGRDIMGTMVNTLILAYTGGALPLLLIFRAYEIPYEQIINMDLIATEVVRSLVGSLGLMTAIPLTALFFVLFTKRHEQKG